MVTGELIRTRFCARAKNPGKTKQLSYSLARLKAGANQTEQLYWRGNWGRTSGPANKPQKILMMKVRATDTGEASCQITAFRIPLDDFRDYQTARRFAYFAC